MQTGLKPLIRELHVNEWSQFEAAILRELGRRELVVRAFDLVTFDGIEEGNPIEISSLDTVRRTGTDRRANAHFWNVQGFDYEHDQNHSGKAADEIIYAFWLDFRASPYLASRALGDGEVAMEAYDITEGLNEHNGLIVYDPAMLEKKSPNEYWFKNSPLNAALLLILLTTDDQ